MRNFTLASVILSILLHDILDGARIITCAKYASLLGFTLYRPPYVLLTGETEVCTDVRNSEIL